MSDNNFKNNKNFSFSPDEIRAVLQSEAGRQLIQLLNRDGGSTLKQASDSFQKGDYRAVQDVLQPIMETEKAKDLVQQINEKKKGSHGSI